MSYTAIASRRMPFDIDGTAVGQRSGVGGSIEGYLGQGVSSWLNSTELGNLNGTARAQTWGYGWDSSPSQYFWFFFPETREVTQIFVDLVNASSGIAANSIQGSLDSTNGMDGTWMTGTYTLPSIPTSDTDSWRKNVFTVSFPSAVKVLRVGFRTSGGTGNGLQISGVHIYGMKAAGQTPDDVVFCSSDGTEYTSLQDWGNSPEGTTAYGSFYLKNVSSKTANGLNIQLNHTDFMISTDQAIWKAVIDIASLSPEAISAPIYTRRLLQPPLLTLGPKQARAILTIASFT